MQPATRLQGPRTTASVAEDALFKEGLDYVQRSLCQLGVPDTDRDDLAQEILIAVYAKRQAYRAERGAPRQWLRGFVKNFMHAYRRTRDKIRRRIAELPPDLADTTAGAEEQTVAKQLRRLLHEELLPQVDLDLRTVVIAHDLDALHFETIAEQQQIPLSTVHNRYQRGIAQLQTAYKRHQRRQRAQGLVVLPVPLAHLLAADRVIPEGLDELVERAWSRVQRARRWRNRWAAVRALLRRPALHLGVTFLGGGGLGAALALALQPTPHPAPVVFVQPTLTEPAPVVAITLASASLPMSAVAALPVPPASSSVSLASGSVSSARSGQHRKTSAEQRAFDIAHQAFLRGSFKEALAALKAQERDYPAGELAAERESLRAQIARLGDTSER
jgi:RNA polymerase sigma factor (sigma-70 family)